MSSTSMSQIGFILSLIGGIVIIVGSLIAIFLYAFGFPYATYYGMGPGMMTGFWTGYGSGMMTGLTVVSLVCGVIVLIGALMLKANPSDHITWGAIILIFSLASFAGMGGYFLGAILGIAGGALALSYRATSTTKTV